MRLIALTCILLISLSGCAMRVTYDEAGDVQEATGQPTSTTHCTMTQNGVTRDCSGPSLGPKQNVSIDERAPLTDGLDQSWTFAVHPGAEASSVWFAIDGYDGGDASATPDRGCLKLTGPVSKTTGHCTGGSGNVNLAISGNIVNMGPQVALQFGSLPVGDYTLMAKIPQGVADYHVVIDVHY